MTIDRTGERIHIDTPHISKSIQQQIFDAVYVVLSYFKNIRNDIYISERTDPHMARFVALGSDRGFWLNPKRFTKKKLDEHHKMYNGYYVDSSIYGTIMHETGHWIISQCEGYDEKIDLFAHNNPHLMHAPSPHAQKTILANGVMFEYEAESVVLITRVRGTVNFKSLKFFQSEEHMINAYENARRICAIISTCPEKPPMSEEMMWEVENIRRQKVIERERKENAELEFDSNVLERYTYNVLERYT